jgi:vacuolar-type H+-ATPase subunit I/STV1
MCGGKGHFRNVLGMDQGCVFCNGTGIFEVKIGLEGEKEMAKKKEKSAEEVLLEQIKEKEQELKELREEIKDLEKYKQYEQGANEIKAIHDAFMNAGFSNGQAFDLVKGVMKLAAPMVTDQNLFR